MIVTRNVSLKRAFWNLRQPLLPVLLCSMAVTAIEMLYPEVAVRLAPLPLTAAGAAISIFLAFTNNASYNRFWEGRTLWGRLVNASRSCVRQLRTFTGETGGESDGDMEREAFVRESVYGVIAFAHALRHHLRDEDACLELASLLSEDEMRRLRQMRNIPAGILVLQGERLARARQRGWLDSITLAALDETLTEFAAIQGGCERINNTPLPPIYTAIGHKVTLLYCYLLPLGLVRDMGGLTPFVVLVLASAFLFLSMIALLLEKPFGLRANDLPLTALCRTIEIDLRQALGAADAPEPLRPENGILL